MNEAKSAPAEIQVFGLVRDKEGNPRFDSIKGIPAPLWGMLSAEEQQDIISRGGYPSE